MLYVVCGMVAKTKMVWKITADMLGWGWKLFESKYPEKRVHAVFGWSVGSKISPSENCGFGPFP